MCGKIAAGGDQQNCENTTRIARCGEVRLPSPVVLQEESHGLAVSPASRPGRVFLADRFMLIPLVRLRSHDEIVAM